MISRSIATRTCPRLHREVSGTSVTLWVEGGVDGETYTVSVEATTTQGRVKELCFRLRVRDC